MHFDTAKLYYDLNMTEYEEFKKRMDGLKQIPLLKGLELYTSKQHRINIRIYLFIRFTDLLTNHVVNDHTLVNTIENIDIYLCEHLGISIHDFKLIRIDYKMDCIIPSEQDRKAVLKLIQKKAYNIKGHRMKWNESETTVYYNSKLRKKHEDILKQKAQYEAQSSTIIIYDKMNEQISKKGTVSNEFKNVLRFEFRVKSKHLTYMKKKYGVEKTLLNYLNQAMYEKYITNIKRLLGIGDFYKVDTARKIINNSNIDIKIKAQLIVLLVEISRSSISTVKVKIENGKRKYSDYSFNKLISILSELNINPLLLSKNWKCADKILNPVNFIRKENQ